MHHKYLTLVVDHDHRCAVWGAKGKDLKTLDGCFNELGPEPSAQLEAVSMDLGPAYPKSMQAKGHAPQAVIRADPFHVVKPVTEALDEVRRESWRQLRRLPDDRWAKDFKGSRWAFVKVARTIRQRRDLILDAIEDFHLQWSGRRLQHQSPTHRPPRMRVPLRFTRPSPWSCSPRPVDLKLPHE